MPISQERIETLSKWADEFCDEHLHGDYEVLKVTTDPDDEYMKRGWHVAVVLQSTLRVSRQAVLRLWDVKAEKIGKQSFHRELLDVVVDADFAELR
jgi:hypothetical protein